MSFLVAVLGADEWFWGFFWWKGAGVTPDLQGAEERPVAIVLAKKPKATEKKKHGDNRKCCPSLQLNETDCGLLVIQTGSDCLSADEEMLCHNIVRQQ